MDFMMEVSGGNPDATGSIFNRQAGKKHKIHGPSRQVFSPVRKGCWEFGEIA